MNRLKALITVSILCMGFMSCTNDPDKRGSSTPIDSSNLHGAPGATYGPDNPVNPNPPVYEGQYDTGMQPNTMNHDDSVKQGLISK